MKIGILTQPLWFNYGGLLQNYALQKVLQRMGHEVYTIDRQPDMKYSYSPIHMAGYIVRLIKRYIFFNKNIKTSWNPNVSKSTFMYISQNTLEFVKNNITTTCPVSSSQLSEIAARYMFDAYVVGSDQVWIPSYYPEAFIPFDSRVGVKKIFYAASSGDESWMDSEMIRESALKMLSGFCGISVREKSLQKRFNEISKLECEHVSDPTLLLDREDYINLLDENSEYTDHIFTYILDTNDFKQRIIEAVEECLKLDVHSGTPTLSYNNAQKTDIDEAVFAPVESWLQHYYNASFVVTDSFHGTVFSLIFNKQFLVIGNRERGLDRFTSLLDDYGLSNRIVTSLDEVKELVNTTIDFNTVNRKMREKKIKSLDFLTNSLNK